MKNIILEFINRTTAGQPVLRGQVNKIYKKLFEQSATDINKKQIAADPGTCSQGILPNENLANDQETPDGIVGDLMRTSYASRFGQEKSVVNPGRTTLGICGSPAPQNVNASAVGDAN